MFRKGQKVKFSEEALENYGEEYRGKVYKIIQWYDHYVLPQFMMQDEHGHPGFDGAGCPPGTIYLYHLGDLNFDLYDWELERA
jgi:hypothetical protein